MLQKEDVLEFQEKNSRKIKFTLVIIFILLFIIIILGFSFYKYFKSPEKKLELGAEIEEARITEDGKTAYTITGNVVLDFAKLLKQKNESSVCG